MGTVKYNAQTGKAIRIENGVWVDTPLKHNPSTGESIAFDGKGWSPVGGGASLPPLNRDVKSIVANPSEVIRQAPAMRTASPSLFQGITDAGVRGVTGGISDPVSALGRATGDTIADAITGEDSGSFGQLYNRNLSQIRGDERAFSRENPYVGGTAELGGMVVNPVMFGAGKYISEGANIGQRMVRGAVTGAPITGVYSGATAEPGQQLSSATQGTVLGGAFGALSIPVIEGAIGLTRGALQKAIGVFGGDLTRAGQQVSEIIREIGGGDLQSGIAVVKKRIDDFGEDAVLADVLGQRGTNMASGASLVPGRTRDVADDFVTTRQQGRPQRLHSAADEISSGEFYPTIEATTKTMRENAKPLYDEAFAPVSDANGRVFARWDQRLEDLLQSPDIKNAMAVGIENEKRLALAGNRAFSFEEYAVKGFDDAGNLIFDGTPNLRSMDAAKRGLDSMINKHRDGVTGKINWDADPSLRSLDALRKSLVSKLDEITTVDGRSVYAEARKAWSGPATEMDAMWQGRRFLKSDEEVSKSAFDKLSPENQEMFLLGVRREVTKIINTDTQTATNKFADKKADLWIRFRNILPEKKFKAFKSSIETEIQKAKNETAINPKYGSPTELNRQNVNDLSRAPSILVDTLDSAKSGGIFGVLSALGGGVSSYLRSPSKKVANDVVNMLLEMDPARQSTILDTIGRRVIIDEYVPYLSKSAASSLSSIMSANAPNMRQSLSRDMTETPTAPGSMMEPIPTSQLVSRLLASPNPADKAEAFRIMQGGATMPTSSYGSGLLPSGFQRTPN